MGSQRCTSAGAFRTAPLRDLRVVVRDFDFVGIAILPSEADAKLLIDAHTVLTAATADQPFKAIARWNRQFAQVANTVELCELAADDRPELARTGRPSAPGVNAIEEIFRCTIGKRAYHAQYYNGIRSP